MGTKKKMQAHVSDFFDVCCIWTLGNSLFQSSAQSREKKKRTLHEPQQKLKQNKTNNKLKVRTHSENGFYNSSVYVLPLNIHITQLSNF